jgi:glutamate/aspartate transport system substrate-binding protein
MGMTRWLSALFFLGCLTCLAFGQPVQSTLEKIKSAKTITMGYCEASLPFSFVSNEKKPVGYVIDLCARVAAGIQQQFGLDNLQVKWTPVTPENRITMVTNGTIDLECGTTTNTLSRQEQVDFSHMTFVDGGS